MSSCKNWTRKFQASLHKALAFIVFLFLDFLDAIFCLVYKCLDKFIEGKFSPCYCGNKGSKMTEMDENGIEDELSESLYGRNNVFSRMGSLVSPRKRNHRFSHIKPAKPDSGELKNRWSDCNCEYCLSWIKDGGEKLHVVVREPSGASSDEITENNVIFIHGFLCSSSFWTESVFRNLSETAKNNYRLFAVDLLGFGRSPKPHDCLYTLKDHLEMIEKSVINPYELKSFHLVAHSMGCPIALAVAAKYPSFIKSITLVAPACFSCGKDEASVEVLKRLAEKKLWPPEVFHRSLMAWYEHLARSMCFLICRNHIRWERILKLLTRRRELNFAVKDLTKHTHLSAWHNVHNVICGGAKFLDGFLEIIKKSGVKIRIIHGDRDNTIPLDCSHDIKRKVPHAELSILPYANHSSVILRRKKDFTQDLELFWASSRQENSSP